MDAVISAMLPLATNLDAMRAALLSVVLTLWANLHLEAVLSFLSGLLFSSYVIIFGLTTIIAVFLLFVLRFVLSVYRRYMSLLQYVSFCFTIIMMAILYRGVLMRLVDKHRPKQESRSGLEKFVAVIGVVIQTLATLTAVTNSFQTSAPMKLLLDVSRASGHLVSRLSPFFAQNQKVTSLRVVLLAKSFSTTSRDKHSIRASATARQLVEALGKTPQNVQDAVYDTADDLASQASYTLDTLPVYHRTEPCQAMYLSAAVIEHSDLFEEKSVDVDENIFEQPLSRKPTNLTDFDSSVTSLLPPPRGARDLSDDECVPNTQENLQQVFDGLGFIINRLPKTRVARFIWFFRYLVGAVFFGTTIWRYFSEPLLDLLRHCGLDVDLWWAVADHYYELAKRRCRGFGYNARHQFMVTKLKLFLILFTIALVMIIVMNDTIFDALSPSFTRLKEHFKAIPARIRGVTFKATVTQESKGKTKRGRAAMRKRTKTIKRPSMDSATLHTLIDKFYSGKNLSPEEMYDLAYFAAVDGLPLGDLSDWPQDMQDYFDDISDDIEDYSDDDYDWTHGDLDPFTRDSRPQYPISESFESFNEYRKKKRAPLAAPKMSKRLRREAAESALPPPPTMEEFEAAIKKHIAQSDSLKKADVPSLIASIVTNTTISDADMVTVVSQPSLPVALYRRLFGGVLLTQNTSTHSVITSTSTVPTPATTEGNLVPVKVFTPHTEPGPAPSTAVPPAPQPEAAVLNSISIPESVHQATMLVYYNCGDEAPRRRGQATRVRATAAMKEVTKLDLQYILVTAAHVIRDVTTTDGVTTTSYPELMYAVPGAQPRTLKSLKWFLPTNSLDLAYGYLDHTDTAAFKEDVPFFAMESLDIIPHNSAMANDNLAMVVVNPDVSIPTRRDISVGFGKLVNISYEMLSTVRNASRQCKFGHTISTDQGISGAAVLHTRGIGQQQKVLVVGVHTNRGPAGDTSGTVRYNIAESILPAAKLRVAQDVLNPFVSRQGE